MASIESLHPSRWDSHSNQSQSNEKLAEFSLIVTGIVEWDKPRRRLQLNQSINESIQVDENFIEFIFFCLYIYINKLDLVERRGSISLRKVKPATFVNGREESRWRPWPYLARRVSSFISYHFVSFLSFSPLFLQHLLPAFIQREREKEMLEEPQRTRATATTTKRQRQETAQTQSDDWTDQKHQREHRGIRLQLLFISSSNYHLCTLLRG